MDLFTEDIIVEDAISGKITGWFALSILAFRRERCPL